MKDSWDSFWRSSDDSRILKASYAKKRILRVLRRYAKSGMRALDAGCGSGFFAKCFVSMGLETSALDYSPEAIQLARRVAGESVSYYVEDLLDPALPDRLTSKFDVIFSDGLFEHFPRDRQAVIMENLQRLRAPEGIIATFVPNRWSPWQLIRPFLMPGIQECPFPLARLVHLNQGMTILEKGGLNVLPCFLSPERALGPIFGMLLYTIAR